MAPVDYTDPGFIAFMKENNEKTAKLRARWNELHRPKMLRAAAFVGKEKGYTEKDVTIKLLEACMPTLTRENINAGYNRRKRPKQPYIYTTKDLIKEHSVQSMGLGDPKSDPILEKPSDDTATDPVMRPISAEQENIFRTKGRVAYLKERSRMKQEDKYYFEECSSWQHGWKIQDSYFGCNTPKYPHQPMLTKGRNSRTGGQPDPSHYALSTSIQTHNQCLM